MARRAKSSKLPDRVHTWPYLVRLEMIVATFVMALLTVWSITIDAPLEGAADTTVTPNPSKAPWYFLGLQELLVYFDPWIAGVVLPSLIIIGLMVIPYVDVNPKGNGYYCFRDRWFAISVYLFGFVALWLATIMIGTFLRGPGWYLFWPGEHWDVHKTVAITNRDWPQLFGINGRVESMLFGGASVLLFLLGPPALWWRYKRKTSATLRRLGALRYWIVAFLFMCMTGVVVKIVLRVALNVKYVMVGPYNFNI